MTARALHALGLAMDILPVNGLGNRQVAVAARCFHHLVAQSGDLNRVRIFSGGEVKRMKETVSRLHRVFADQVVRRVTVIARRRGMMAGLEPSVVLVVHHMAVGACAGIVEEVGVALGINKGITANADDGAGQNQQGKFEHRQTHVGSRRLDVRTREILLRNSSTLPSGVSIQS